MACREHHRIEHCLGSLKGYWILAGGNTPGHHPPMVPRPGVAPEKFKVRQGMQSESRYARKVRQGIIPKSTVDLGCAAPCAHRQVFFMDYKSKIRNLKSKIPKTLVIKRAHSKSRLLTPTKRGGGGPLKINLCRLFCRHNIRHNNLFFNNL
jgi:hypothetical protein